VLGSHAYKSGFGGAWSSVSRVDQNPRILLKLCYNALKFCAFDTMEYNWLFPDICDNVGKLGTGARHWGLRTEYPIQLSCALGRAAFQGNHFTRKFA
jgi:hypothetical protein